MNNETSPFTTAAVDRSASTLLDDWVQTTDRQPSHEQRVIIWFENDFHRAIYSDKNKRFYLGAKTAVQATHWMKGPKAPDEC